MCGTYLVFLPLLTSSRRTIHDVEDSPARVSNISITKISNHHNALPSWRGRPTLIRTTVLDQKKTTTTSADDDFGATASSYARIKRGGGGGLAGPRVAI
jgi:hypothetical protein